MDIRTRVDIAAPADVVWRVLVDFPRYPEWNPLTVAVEGVPVAGADVTLHVVLGRQRLTRVHHVTRVEPGRELTWAIVHPLGLWVHGERSQTIEPAGPGRCVYANHERVGGVQGWLARQAGYEALVRQAIEAVGQRLKERAEALADVGPG